MQLLPNQSDLGNMLVGKLYQRHWLELFMAIGQSVSSQEDAEDILLDVFLAALENAALPSMSDQHQEAWLRRVAYNKCMDFHRRVMRRPALPLEGNTELLHDEKHCTPEWAALRQEELVQLHKHFASLSAVQQELLRLRFADELSCGQIAAHMHKSEGAIRTMLSRTLNFLRGIYTRQRDNSYE